MLSLPKGLSTLQSLSVQPCWQGLPAETLYVPAEGGFQPALLCCSAEQYQQSGRKHFLTSTAPRKQRGTILPAGVCLRSQEQGADLALGFVSSPARVGCGDRLGMLSLQARGKSSFCKVSLLVQVPVRGASYLGTMEGVGRLRIHPMNALFLVPFCCSPPLRVMQ